MTICDIIKRLESFWQEYNVKKIDSWDMQMGAATFHPMCFINVLSDKNFNFMYVQASRRPSDGKYGRSPNRVVRHHQFQVIINPLIINIQEIYLESLYALGLDKTKNDIKFVENNWESTALGAFGVGWEVWINGMEVTQFTFFTKMADIVLNNTVVEMAYGVERLALVLNKSISFCFFDLEWDRGIFYKDLFAVYEQQSTEYYLEMQNINNKKKNMELLIDIENNLYNLLEKNLYFMAYELFLEYNQIFNLLIAGRLISPIERKEYLNQMRAMVNACGKVIIGGKK